MLYATRNTTFGKALESDHATKELSDAYVFFTVCVRAFNDGKMAKRLCHISGHSCTHG